MFNNITCEKFKHDINNIISNCELPPVVAYYILKDSIHELESICQEVLEYESKNSTEEECTEKVELLDEETKKNLEKTNALAKKLEEAE